MDRNARLNALMATTIHSWPGEYVPLSVRYRAAQAADDILEEWFALVGELDPAAVHDRRASVDRGGSRGQV